MKLELEIKINGLEEMINLGFEVLAKSDKQTELLRAIHAQNGKIMALGDDILQAVTDEDTKVDSVIALLNGLAADGTITPQVKAAILAKIKGSEDKLDTAINANTSPPTT